MSLYYPFYNIALGYNMKITLHSSRIYLNLDIVPSIGPEGNKPLFLVSSLVHSLIRKRMDSDKLVE